jgi:hypothetical protein
MKTSKGLNISFQANHREVFEKFYPLNNSSPVQKDFHQKCSKFYCREQPGNYQKTCPIITFEAFNGLLQATYQSIQLGILKTVGTSQLFHISSQGQTLTDCK